MSSVNTELIAKIRTCLESRIVELVKEQDAIYPDAASEYRSHDEMAMDDQHWDELDIEVMKTQALIDKLDLLPAALAGAGHDGAEIDERLARIQTLVDALMPILPPAEEQEPEEDITDTWGEREDCRYCAGCYYCSEGGGFDLADEF